MLTFYDSTPAEFALTLAFTGTQVAGAGKHKKTGGTFDAARINVGADGTVLPPLQRASGCPECLLGPPIADIGLQLVNVRYVPMQTWTGFETGITSKLRYGRLLASAVE